MYEKPPGTNLKKHLLQKLVLTFSLEFQQFFSITRTIFFQKAKNSLCQKTNFFSYGNVMNLFTNIKLCHSRRINSDGQSDTMYGTSRRDQASIHDGPFAACWWSGFFFSHFYFTRLNPKRIGPS